jgi:hypothetical protein
VKHCYPSSFSSLKGNEISAYWDDSTDTDIDFSFMTHKNEELIIRYLSSISGKQFLGHVGPERKTQIVYTYKPFSIGTYI